MPARPTQSRPGQSVSQLVDRAWKRVEKHFEGDPNNPWRAQAVGEVLEAVEKRSDVLGDLAGEVLAGALGAWLRGHDEAALRYLEEASAREVIDAVKHSVRALAAEARRVESQRQAFLALAKDLGKVGVKLLLGVLLAV